ncbi:hypothetical protein GQ457_06G032260 [Hibiscus cannabinus]
MLPCKYTGCLVNCEASPSVSAVFLVNFLPPPPPYTKPFCSTPLFSSSAVASPIFQSNTQTLVSFFSFLILCFVS